MNLYVHIYGHLWLAGTCMLIVHHNVVCFYGIWDLNLSVAHGQNLEPHRVRLVLPNINMAALNQKHIIIVNIEKKILPQFVIFLCLCVWYGIKIVL